MKSAEPGTSTLPSGCTEGCPPLTTFRSPTLFVASADEQTLLEERPLLKEGRAQQQARATLPKAKAVRPVKEARPPRAPKAPKAPKVAKAPKEAKVAAGNKPSRAERLTKKAENLEAARKATKKSAKP